jgi:hypothetical protein
MAAILIEPCITNLRLLKNGADPLLDTLNPLPFSAYRPQFADRSFD